MPFAERKTHETDGFDFLGVNIRMYDGKLLTKSSKKKLRKDCFENQGYYQKEPVDEAGVVNP